MADILKSKRFSLLGSCLLGTLLCFPCLGSGEEQAPEFVDLGQYGSLFEIAEEDMLEHLMKRLKTFKESGKLKEIEDDFKEKAKNRVLNPPPVKGVSQTRVERSFTVDPSLVLEEDIKDHQGNAIARAGKKVNPLQHLSLSKGMVFIDGTKQDQVDWAIHHQDRFLIVLTNGSPLKREEEFGVKFYFDQAGIITKKYGIHHVPARLEQEGDLLRITEFVIAASSPSPARRKEP